MPRMLCLSFYKKYGFSNGMGFYKSIPGNWTHWMKLDKPKKPKE